MTSKRLGSNVRQPGHRPEELRALAEGVRAATMATAESREAWRKFLESTPPNSSVKIPHLVASKHSGGGQPYQAVIQADIQLHCQVDGGVRRFKPGSTEVVLRNRGEFVFIGYVCRDCQRESRTFAVLVHRKKDEDLDVEVMKLGEYPPFTAPISKKIEKLLTDADLELYRKGTRAESQGLGIGAATYFRRIVEAQWKLLVSEIRDAALKLGHKDTSVYEQALQETQLWTAVELLKDALPEKLLILDGENPLTLLYRPLSRGIHGLSDAECLEQAGDIREVLTALLENIGRVFKDQAELRSAVSRLKSS